MQMLDAFATIANGGMTRPPRLLDATIDGHGKRHVAPSVAGKARRLGRDGDDDGDDARRRRVAAAPALCAAMPGYPVAGKTGTAKKPLPSGKYSDSAHMASFIGFAPADHPRFAAMVVLDDPAGVYASVTAAPVWSEIMQSALTRYSVPPTDATDVQYKAAQAAKLPGMNCAVPHGAALVTHPASAATPGSLPNDPNPNPNQGH